MIERDLPSLLERVRRTEKPDRVLDALLHIHLRGCDRNYDGPQLLTELDDIKDVGGELEFLYTERHAKGPRRGERKWGCWGYHVAGAITESIDAALRLVNGQLPGCHWVIEDAREVGFGAGIQLDLPIGPDGISMAHDARGATPALALIAVLLECLIDKAAEEARS